MESHSTELEDIDAFRAKVIACRDHLKKYPDCLDRGIQEANAEKYERWAKEIEAYGRTIEVA